MTLVSVQPFGIQDPGGGPRILRALFGAVPDDVVNVCTNKNAPQPCAPFVERHIPIRRHLGRIESTRAKRVLRVADLAGGQSFVRELSSVCEEVGASALHSVAHSFDFIYTHRVARSLGVPFYLTVHDDLRYEFNRYLGRRRALTEIARSWRDADHRFVISESLGAEYCRRYGERSYSVVTDGVSEVHDPRLRDEDRRRIYFAGLFHLSYRDNLASLLEAARLRHGQVPSLEMTFRCGALDPQFLEGPVPVTALPFADEGAVERDMQHASLLYLPLPFGARYADFVNFSLSTKLVTYLASGLPILYHGPTDSAACRLLTEHEAAIIAPSLEPSVVAHALAAGFRDADRIVANARRLALEQFTLERQRETFWGAVRASPDRSRACARSAAVA